MGTEYYQKQEDSTLMEKVLAIKDKSKKDALKQLPTNNENTANNSDIPKETEKEYTQCSRCWGYGRTNLKCKNCNTRLCVHCNEHGFKYGFNCDCSRRETNSSKVPYHWVPKTIKSPKMKIK